MKPTTHTYFLIIMLAAIWIPDCKAQISGKPEDIMTSYINSFTKLMQWPDEETSGSFIIKIFGECSITESLKRLANQTVNGKKIDIEEIDQISEIANCKILFISKKEKGRLEEILHETEKENVLTIANNTGFGKKGVGINFILMGSNIRFEINLKVLNKTEINYSSRLLRIATKIIE